MKRARLSEERAIGILKEHRGGRQAAPLQCQSRPVAGCSSTAGGEREVRSIRFESNAMLSTPSSPPRIRRSRRAEATRLRGRLCRVCGVEQPRCRTDVGCRFRRRCVRVNAGGRDLHRGSRDVSRLHGRGGRRPHRHYRDRDPRSSRRGDSCHVLRLVVGGRERRVHCGRAVKR